MTAQQAREITNGKKRGLEDVLSTIKWVAESGDDYCIEGKQNMGDHEKIIKELTDLGYTVEDGSNPNNLKISW